MQQSDATLEIIDVLSWQPRDWALFLDIDGTLVDLALTPDAISVPEGLPERISRVSARLGGALALVTGRSLDYADSLFAPIRFPIAGLHGAELRAADTLVLPEPTEAFEDLKQALRREAENYPGVLIEDKGAAVAAHYRLAPQLETMLGERMRDYAELAGPKWALQLGKMVFELRPARSSKGDALERFLQTEPFAERRPIAIGDDLTDESMFAVANARGGLSVRVGQAQTQTCAVLRLPSPEEVRRLIAVLADAVP